MDGLALSDIDAELARRGMPVQEPAPQPHGLGLGDIDAELQRRGLDPAASLPPAPEKTGGMARNLAAGANEAIANTVGAPVDAVAWALNQLAVPADPLEGPLTPPQLMGDRAEPPASTAQPVINNPIGGSESIKSALGYIGADPRNVGANTPEDRIARGTGAGIASMVAPTMAARRIVGEMVPGLARSAVQSLADVGLPTGAAIGAVGGAAGSSAAEVVPEQYKALADAGGQMVGGGVAGGMLAGARALANAGVNAARTLGGPFIPSVAKGIAAEKFAKASSDPRALGDTLDTQPSTLVPGSEPTTYQLSGDTGIGQLERAYRTQQPAPFLDRATEQNAARVDAVQGLSPENANPHVVGDLFRQQLAAIDNAGQTNVRSAEQTAVERLAAAGGTQAPEQYGETLRNEMEAAKASVKQRESALWKAIDPDGSLTIEASPVAKAANDITAEIPKTALPPQGEEAAILTAAKGMVSGPQPFSDFSALRSRLTTAIRQEVGTNGQTPAWRRMTMLRGAMDDTMAGRVAEVGQEQAQAVAAGAISAEDTMVARLAEQARGHYIDRDARIPGAISQLAAGGSGGVYPGSSAAGRSAGTVGALGESGAGNRGPGNDAGNPSVQSPQPVATFDPEASARYRAAADATKARAQIFNNPLVGPLLQERGGFYGVPETNVPGRALRSGQSVEAARDAGAQPATMQDALVADLRQRATDPDGTLNVNRYQAWLRSRADTLRQFPELQQRLGRVAAAQEAVDTAAGEAKAQLDAYRQSAARHFLNAEPRQAVASAFNSKTPAADFGQLAQLTVGAPDARAGLQHAIVDHMLAATQSNRPAGNTGIAELNPDAFQKYLGRNRAALEQVFTPAQMDSMTAVAADLQRSNLSITGSKIPGSPGTAQDLAAVKTSILGNIVRRLGGGIGGYLAGGVHGAVEGMVGGEAANAIKRAGLNQIDKLIVDALLNPERAKALLMEYTPRTSASVASRLRSAYGANTLATALANQPSDKRQPKASPLAGVLATGAPAAP